MSKTTTILLPSHITDLEARIGLPDAGGALTEILRLHRPVRLAEEGEALFCRECTIAEDDVVQSYPCETAKAVTDRIPEEMVEMIGWLELNEEENEGNDDA